MFAILFIFIFILLTNAAPSSLNMILFSLSFVILSYKATFIFKKEVILYLIGFIVSVFSMIFYNIGVFSYLISGQLGLSLFLIVMFTGVFPIQWSLTKLLIKLRGTLSILGFILISPHAVLHLFEIIGGINIFGIAAYALMIPLTIISFKTIRREINARDWKNIQKASYVIYLILFAHIISIATWFDIVIYAVLLTLYVNNKLYKEFKK